MMARQCLEVKSNVVEKRAEDTDRNGGLAFSAYSSIVSPDPSQGGRPRLLAGEAVGRRRVALSPTLVGACPR